jgi:VWFA-related protein
MNELGIMSRAIALLTAGGILLSGSSTFLQSASQNPPEQHSQSDVAIRIATRMVQVNVIAVDSNGRPVTDLTKDDFTVTDDGAAQKIALFTPLGSAPRIPPVETSATPAIHTYSNRIQSEPSLSTSVNMILLDAVNTDFGDMSYARAQVMKYLRQVRPEDQVALYLLTSSKLYILHDFTSDSATLVRVMGGAKKNTDSADMNATAADAANKRMNKALGDAFAESNRFYKGISVDRAGVTSEAMQDIARRVASIPGRKNLIWVSSGFPININYGNVGNVGPATTRSFVGVLSNTAKALNNANVSVYPIDARGLIGEDILSMVNGSTKILSGAAPDDRPFATMSNIAAGTGGEALYNGNDLANFIRHAIDASRESYAIGYYPDHNKWDGTFREIRVTVNRPGITLRYRKGYFASTDTPNNPDKQKQAISEALHSPVQLVDLGLEARVTPSDVPSGHQLKVDIHVSSDQMHFEKNADRWTDSIEIAWAELSADGRIVARGGHTLALKPGQNGYAEIQRDGLSFSEHVSVKNDAVEMRLLVRDNGSGATGSINIPVSQLNPNSLSH